jgi:Na+/proline symporter
VAEGGGLLNRCTVKSRTGGSNPPLSASCLFGLSLTVQVAMGKDKNHVSVWFWLLAILLMTLPCINIVIALVGALVGENESRKNYFRAWIIWFLICTLVGAVMLALGFMPLIYRQIQEWIH